jgi:hypothetical protein
MISLPLKSQANIVAMISLPLKSQADIVAMISLPLKSKADCSYEQSTSAKTRNYTGRLI